MKRSQSGFTLIEILIASALMLTVFSTLLFLIYFSNTNIKKSINTMRMMQEGRIASQQMAMYAMEAETCTILSPSGLVSNSQLQVDVPKISTDGSGNVTTITHTYYITYYFNPLSDADPRNHTLILDNDPNIDSDSNERVIAKNVTRMHDGTNFIPVFRRGGSSHDQHNRIAINFLLWNPDAGFISRVKIDWGNLEDALSQTDAEVADPIDVTGLAQTHAMRNVIKLRNYSD